MSDKRDPQPRAQALPGPLQIAADPAARPGRLVNAALSDLSRAAAGQLPFGATHRYTIDRRYPIDASHHPVSVVLDGEDLLASLLGESGELLLVRCGPDGRERSRIGPLAAGAGPTEIGDPAGLALDDAGNLYLLDAQNGRVLKLDPTGRVLGHFGGVEGIAPGALAFPRDLEVGPDGGMLLADTRNHRVQRWDTHGRHVMTIGPVVDEDEDEAVPSGDGPGEFLEPMGVTEDAQGRIYVADTGNHRIQVFDADGRFLRVFGSEGEGSGQISSLTDVRVVSDGAIFVFDLYSRRVQKFSPDGLLEYGVVLCPEGPERIVGAVGDIDVGPDESFYVPVPAEHEILRVRRTVG